MYIDAPDSANKGSSFTVQISNIPGNAEKLRIDKDGMLGQAREVSGQRKTVTLSHSFAGRISLTAVALDKFGDTLDSASTSITIKDPAFDNADAGAPGGFANPEQGFGDGGQGKQAATLYCAKPRVGQPWRLRFANVAPYHSLVVEFYGSNGGIFRLFPRGRNEMITSLSPKKPGPVKMKLSLRNNKLGVVDVQTYGFDVAPAGDQMMQGQPGDMDFGKGETGLSIDPMSELKPPNMVPHDTFTGEEFVMMAAEAGHNQGSSLPASFDAGRSSIDDMRKDMQARSDALLDRLKKR
ncbi:hypothetical protein WNY37_17345 [Henriciella sp. AS95]|uniref:hypothetical protein n=1 Tax=Henriciella sp. AS95 TaxID=3135782 RepID=UPI00317FE3D7